MAFEFGKMTLALVLQGKGEVVNLIKQWCFSFFLGVRSKSQVGAEPFGLKGVDYDPRFAELWGLHGRLLGPRETRGGWS